MENTCLCCGKKIDGISWDLTNGCICDDCYEEAKRCSGKITHRNIRLYSGEEIKNIISSVNNGEKVYSVVLHSANNHAFEVIKEIRELKSCDLTHAKGLVDNAPSIICDNLAKNKSEIILKAFENIGATVEMIEGTEIISKVDNNTEQPPVSTIPPKTESSSAPTKEENKEKSKKSPFATIKAIGWTMVAIIAIICIMNPSFKEEMTEKIANKVLELDGTAYIEMVKDVDFIEGLTYGEWLDGNDYFESKEWKFFKNDGNKYVQFNGVGNGDVLQIKFALECVNEKEGEYLITPQNISVNGVSITDVLSLMSLFAAD